MVGNELEVRSIGYVSLSSTTTPILLPSSILEALQSDEGPVTSSASGGFRDEDLVEQFLGDLLRGAVLLLAASSAAPSPDTRFPEASHVASPSSASTSNTPEFESTCQETVQRYLSFEDSRISITVRVGGNITDDHVG